MTKLQEIEQKLLTVNDAVFQNVCDAVLHVLEKEALAIHRTGSQKGKQKTVKGTPDAYFTYPDGRYVFVEYTTKAKKDGPAAFLEKIKADLYKCLDEKETKISLDQLSRIIYCYNATLSPAESEELRRICHDKGVRLELKGIDEIAMLLLGRAAYAAKLYLEVTIDTAQVLPMAQFVQEYERSGFATPLSNAFSGRETELEELTALLRDNQVTIVKGPAGTGKSRLVIAALTNIKAMHPDTQLHCLSNKNAPIFADLRTYIDPQGDHLLFIDDANRQVSNLRTLLPLLKENRTGSLRVVLTVRDYAYPEIDETCREFKPATLEVQRLGDEQLTVILKSDYFNIQNPDYIRRILELTEGNPRLAIMAARVAIKTQDLLKLHDASEIYDEYFQQAIPDQSVFTDKDLLGTLGLIAFFYAIDLTDSNKLVQLLDLFQMDQHTFKDAIDRLERLEMVESSKDYTIVKIGDQVLATYFFYCAFFREQVLDFSLIMQHYFSTHTRRVRDSILPANNTFGYKRVLEKISPALDVYWQQIRTNDELALSFLETFWFYRQEDVFAYIWERVKAMPDVEPCFRYEEEQRQTIGSRADAYLALLDNFYPYSWQKSITALELRFEYLAKKPTLFTDHIRSLSESFVFSHEDSKSKYHRQVELFKLITENMSREVYRATFYALGPLCLRMEYRVHTPSRKRDTLSWYHYGLPDSLPVRRFRKKLWDTLLQYYKEQPAASAKFVDDYLLRSPGWDEAIAAYDQRFLLQVFRKFKPADFYHCCLVQNAVWWFTRLGIATDELKGLKGKFTNETYRLFRLVSFDLLRDKTELDFDIPSDYCGLKDAELRGTVIKDQAAFGKFYERLLFIACWNQHSRSLNLSQAVDVIVSANAERSPELGQSILDHILREGNTARLRLWRLIKILALNLDLKTARPFLQRLLKCGMSERTEYVMYYYTFLPEALFNKQAKADLLNFLAGNSDSNVSIVLERFERFLLKHPDLFESIVRTANQKTSQQLAWSVSVDAITKYAEHLPTTLLEETYLLQDQLQNHYDFSCDGFFILLEKDRGFLRRYIDYLCRDQYFISSREYQHLNRIWDFTDAEQILEDAIVTTILKASITIESQFFEAFFEALLPMQQGRAKAFLKSLIAKYAGDRLKIDFLMELALKIFRRDEQEFVIHFLHVNDDFETFRSISWTESSFSGSRDTNFDLIRAGNWQRILNYIDTITTAAYRYAAHKAYVHGLIAYYQRSAQQEDRERFMSDRY